MVRIHVHEDKERSRSRWHKAFVPKKIKNDDSYFFHGTMYATWRGKKMATRSANLS